MEERTNTLSTTCEFATLQEAEDFCFSKKRACIGILKKRNSKRKPPKRSLNMFLAICFGLMLFLVSGFIIYGALYIQRLDESLPDPDKLIARRSPQTTVIHDRNGEELYKFYKDENRKFVKLDDLPDHFKWAILSTEDLRFYEHSGFDLEAIVKSAYINYVTGDIVRGASTITQQLVRNTLLYDVFGEEAYEESYTRKIKELLLTIRVEQTFTKDEILQMYVNEIGFGGVNYGAQAASVSYFGKDAVDLTLAESAVLAGVIASPTQYSPVYSSSFELPTRRQNAVLDLMLRNKEFTGVSKEDIEDAKREKIRYAPLHIDIEAPHFVFHVGRELEKLYGIEALVHGGLDVKTSLDLSTQKIAEEEVAAGIARYGHPWNVRNGSMLVLDPNTNQILAMVGSVNYWEDANPQIDGNVNMTTSLRQMGSSVKPYTYLAAFQRGYTPLSIVPDRKDLNFGNYVVRNWDNRHFGDITARQALIQSRNVSAVYLLREIGVDAFLDTVRKAGITSLAPDRYYGLSATLGTAEMTLLEHTAAFSIFANDGVKKPVVSILEVKDSDGNVLYEYEENSGERVFESRDINDINYILCDWGGYGDQPLNRYYQINGERGLCGKTGTTDGPRDLVSINYHRNLVVGVWAGNNNNVEVPGAWSTTVPLPIAQSFMKRVSDEYPSEVLKP